MENNSTVWRWTLLTAIAPIVWGSTYFVTREFLPVDSPLWGAAIRALPAGILLFAIRPRRPRGAWWWRSFLLGVLNVSAFFVLVYVAAQLLPTSVASTIMATAPIVMMLFAWALLAQRPTVLPVVGGVIGVLGVALMLSTASEPVAPWGVIASVGALVMSTLGTLLATRWGLGGGVDLVPIMSWQLLAGGALLVPFALIIEGAPPVLDPPALLGFAYVTFVATALAFVSWFGGLRHLPAGSVGLIGLLNPVTGVLLGTLVAGEVLTLQQALGLAIVGAGIVLGQPAARGLFARLRSTGHGGATGPRPAQRP